MTNTGAPFGLQIGGLVRDLAESLPNSPEPGAIVAHLRSLIETTFFASLEREESRFVTPSVALVSAEMMSGRGANRRDWSPIAFETPLPFDIPTLVKLAPAIDARQTLLAVAESGGALAVIGVIRTNSSRYRYARGESSSASSTGYSPVIVRAVGVGTVTIDVGVSRFAILSKGALLPEGLDVLGGGAVWNRLFDYAEAQRLDGAEYTGFLRRVLHDLVDRGHGGTVVVLPDNDARLLRQPYAFDGPSFALRDALLFKRGDRLGPTAEVSVKVIGEPEPDPTEVEIKRQRRRALDEYLFEVDVAGFAADLASVDGALVLSCDLSIVAFGAHIVCSDPQDVRVRLATNGAGTTFEDLPESPLARLGTRHNSAARYCYNRPGAIAFVISQDGIVSCMVRLRDDEQLTLWRPVALEWHWHHKRRVQVEP